MADIIKPCPCCGERIPVSVETENRIFGMMRRVVCDAGKGGCGTQSGLRDTKRDAIRAWNKRAKAPAGKQDGGA